MNYQVKNIYGKTNNKNITVRVDGSKSITARAMLIAALAEGESTFKLSKSALTVEISRRKYIQ